MYWMLKAERPLAPDALCAPKTSLGSLTESGLPALSTPLKVKLVKEKTPLAVAADFRDHLEEAGDLRHDGLGFFRRHLRVVRLVGERADFRGFLLHGVERGSVDTGDSALKAMFSMAKAPLLTSSLKVTLLMLTAEDWSILPAVTVVCASAVRVLMWAISCALSSFTVMFSRRAVPWGRC